MMDKNGLKFPLIRATLSQTVGININEKKVSCIDLEIPSRKRNTTAPLHDKQSYWSSSQFPRKREETEGTRCFERRLKTLETSSRSTEPSGSDCYNERKFVLPLRRHYSEPSLQRRCNPFNIRATSLKLNERAKDKENFKKTFTDFLPSVFFDTRLSNDNPKTNTSSSGPLKTGLKSSEKSPPTAQNVSKSIRNEDTKGSKNSRITSTPRKARGVKAIQDNAKDVDIVHARKKLLPKRRLSDQIDSAYEINCNNDKAFPRRITIQTSQSCPTIVIHECGEEDEAADTTYNDLELTKDTPKQINGGKSLKEDTTSFVSCWRPKQSIVNGKSQKYFY